MVGVNIEFSFRSEKEKAYFNKHAFMHALFDSNSYLIMFSHDNCGSNPSTQNNFKIKINIDKIILKSKLELFGPTMHI